MSIGAKIKAGRLALGMTEQAFGDAVGVTRGAVQQWEKDLTAPRRKVQPEVARVLKISIADLMLDVQVPAQQPLPGPSVTHIPQQNLGVYP